MKKMIPDACGIEVDFTDGEMENLYYTKDMSDTAS